MSENEQSQNETDGIGPDTFESPYDPSPEGIGLETVVDFDTLREDEYFPALDAEYPLRDKSEDPRWALWIVWIWTGLAWFFLLFIITMLVLGIFYD